MSVAIKEVEAKGVLTKSNLPVADFSVNPYVGCAHACKYCYASLMKRFSNHSEPWGEFVDVKFWPPVGNPQRYAGKELFIGSVTDPYQPCEETYGRTRALLEQMQGSGCRVSIATKSDLIVRDLDLIREFPDARVSFSINTLDEGFREEMDDAVSIERRLAAMEKVHAAGVRTTCFISPIFPGITDPVQIIERAKGICNIVWLENLNLRGAYRKVIIDWVAERRPELSGLYEAIYAHADRSYWHELDGHMRTYCADAGLPYMRDDDSTYLERAFDEPPVVVNYFFHEEVRKSAKGR